MQGEFNRVVSRICDEIYGEEINRKIRPRDIPSIVGDSLGGGAGGVNCYPGEPGHACHDTAFFISLSSPDIIEKKRGHLTFEEAVVKMIQHMQGHCSGITRTAILITDGWNARVASAWLRNIKEIQADNYLEIYLINKSGPTLVHI